MCWRQCTIVSRRFARNPAMLTARGVSLSAQASKRNGKKPDGANAQLDTRWWHEKDTLLDRNGRFKLEGYPSQDQLLAEEKIKACKPQSAWEAALRELSSVEIPGHSLYAIAIDICVEAGQHTEAERLWDRMPVSVHGPSRVSVYNMLLKMYKRKKQLKHVERLFSELTREGLEPSIITYSEVIQAYAMHGSWDDAVRLLEEVRGTTQWHTATMRQKQIVFIGAMIACARKGLYTETRKVYDLLQQDGVTANHNHFNALLTACAPSLDITRADHVMAEMQEFGLKPRVSDYSIWMACARNDHAVCEAIFAKMHDHELQPNRLCFEALAEAALQAGEHQRAKDLLVDARAVCDMPPTRKSLRLEAEAEQTRADAHTLRLSRPLNSEGRSPLPPGWFETSCPSSGAPYYWHQNDPQGTVTWTYPRHEPGRIGLAPASS